MSKSRLFLVPLILFFYFPLIFAVTYLIALLKDHINAYFSFISDTGTMPPEQSVFAQMMNMGAALFAYFAYLRYIQVEQYLKLRYGKVVGIKNVVALAFAFICSLGMSIVGNFPELVCKEVHCIGAFLTFIGCSVYSVFQGYFTFKLLPHFQTKMIGYFRTFLGILGIMLYFGAQVTLIVAYNQVKNKKILENGESSLKWAWNDGGYQFRTASVIMEWLLIVIFDLFVVTFVGEFKKFQLDEHTVTFNLDLSNLTAQDRENSVGGEGDFALEDGSSQQRIPSGTGSGTYIFVPDIIIPSNSRIISQSKTKNVTQ